MELSQLRYFLRVAERGNFTLAAKELMISQPALSRSIQKLEEELGQPLLERQTRKVTLSDAGKLMEERARKIFSLVEDAKAEIRDDGQSGRVRVAAIPTVAPYFLPECLQSFQHRFPLAQVIVQEDTTEVLLKKLADGEVDVAIAALPISAKHLQVTTLFEEELLLVTSKEHPLASKKFIKVADFEDLPFVLLGEAHCLADNVISFCQQKQFHPVSVERTNQLAMVQELVTLGHGVSLVPSMARDRDTSTSRVYRSVSGQKPTRTIVMVTNPYRYLTKLVRSFQEHLKEVVKVAL